MGLYELYKPLFEEPNNVVDEAKGDNSDQATSSQKSSLSSSSSSCSQSPFSLHDLYKMECAPGLMLSDSEDSSFASCGTADDFFGPLHLMDRYGSSNNKDNAKHVRFGEARIREYALIVGDHPICQDGLPLSLDWAHSPEWVYEIDDLEWIRQKEQENDDCAGGGRRRRRRRRRRTTKLDYWQRREVLQRVGNYSSADLTRIEQQQNQEAVSEFLAEAAKEMDGTAVPFASHEQGFEFDEHSCSYLELEGNGEGNDDWQMTIQILED